MHPTRWFLSRRSRFAALPLLIAAILFLLTMIPACGSAENGTGPAGAPGTGPGSGGVPTTLVGTWRVVAGAGGQVCDELGHCGGSDGGSESYTFSADGQFEFSQYLVSDLLGCRIVATLYAKGKMTVSGTSMTLSPSYAHQSKQATCEDSFERDVTIDPTPYTWRIAADDAGRPQLFVIGDSGTDGPFDRVP